MMYFFVSCESILLEDNHSLQCYSDSVCNRSDVVSLFYTCTHFHDVIVKSQEPVLIHTLCFFGDAKCRQLVEKYLCQTMSQRKLTAL